MVPTPPRSGAVSWVVVRALPLPSVPTPDFALSPLAFIEGPTGAVGATGSFAGSHPVAARRAATAKAARRKHLMVTGVLRDDKIEGNGRTVRGDRLHGGGENKDERTQRATGIPRIFSVSTGVDNSQQRRNTSSDAPFRPSRVGVAVL